MRGKWDRRTTWFIYIPIWTEGGKYYDVNELHLYLEAKELSCNYGVFDAGRNLTLSIF